MGKNKGEAFMLSFGDCAFQHNHMHRSLVIAIIMHPNIHHHHHHHHHRREAILKGNNIAIRGRARREREMGSFLFEREADQTPFWTASSSEETRMEEMEQPSVAEPEEDEEEVEQSSVAAPEEDEEDEDIRWKCGCSGWREEEWPRKSGGGVTLEGYLETGAVGEGADGVSRTKSLTDEDLEELKGCFDLGFGFNYEEIPELCNTLPALELCYSMSQRFLDEQQQNRSLDRSSSGESMDLCASPTPPPMANWKISSPGDDPDEVKARLKYWAQAVACTIRLCN